MKHKETHEDFYFDEDGLMIFTGHFLLKRARCCGLGCRHCPYGYINVPEPKRTTLLKIKNNTNDFES
ncbi:MAG: DUF5522 domain-containing protein [Ginsengibacter sp.]